MTSSPNQDQTNPAAILEWYDAAGVNLAVGEDSVDRFAASAKAKTARPKSTSGAATPTQYPSAQDVALPIPAQPLDQQENAQGAAQLAAGATNLEELRAVMDSFDGLALKQRARQMVFADGNPEADIMFVGEAPGEEEDRQGKPFVGRSGQLLDLMLAAIGLDRTNIYITNTVPWRPPGNRKPSPAETQTCLPFLHKHIALVNPKILVTLGAPAATNLLGRPVSITKVRGKWETVNIEGKAINLLPTLHPAFLLRQPAQKRPAWQDMLAIKSALRDL